jgi:uncharacterized membrane protein YqaE (UPF0057 family)
MLYLIAILCPALGVILAGRPIRAVLLAILQITLIGWIPAIIIAFIMIGGAHADKRTNKIVRSIKQ